jgi:hypothetical protein
MVKAITLTRRACGRHRRVAVICVELAGLDVLGGRGAALGQADDADVRHALNVRAQR